jgi:hypothetical protein
VPILLNGAGRSQGAWENSEEDLLAEHRPGGSSFCHRRPTNTGISRRSKKSSLTNPLQTKAAIQNH